MLRRSLGLLLTLWVLGLPSASSAAERLKPGHAQELERHKGKTNKLAQRYLALNGQPLHNNGIARREAKTSQLEQRLFQSLEKLESRSFKGEGSIHQPFKMEDSPAPYTAKLWDLGKGISVARIDFGQHGVKYIVQDARPRLPSIGKSRVTQVETYQGKRRGERVTYDHRERADEKSTGPMKKGELSVLTTVGGHSIGSLGPDLSIFDALHDALNTPMAQRERTLKGREDVRSGDPVPPFLFFMAAPPSK